MTPIDDVPNIPPQSGQDQNYITRDLEIELERAVFALVETEQRIGGAGRRAAYARVVVRLKALKVLIGG
jgi:hypothetical protein